MIFGITKRELEKRFRELYDTMISKVNSEVLSFSNRYDNLGKDLALLRKDVSDYDAALKRVGSVLEARVSDSHQQLAKRDSQLERQLTEYEKRLSGLEASQQRAEIVHTVVEPKGEVTFEDVRGLAETVSDGAYRKIRDYFLLEMAKKGYGLAKPGFEIVDSDSQIKLSFIVTNGNRRTPPPFYNFSPAFEDFCPQRLYKTEWNEREAISFNYQFEEYFLFCREEFSCESNWVKQLRKELPELLQAYAIGYSLRRLDEKRFETAVRIQKGHGLKDNPALLSRMSQVMESEPNLANAFLTHYCSEK